MPLASLRVIGSCYVPGCRSGNIGPPVQLFQLAFTASEDIRQKWLSNIPPRTDRGFDFDKDGLCIEHFKEEYVIKTGLGINANEGGEEPEETNSTTEQAKDDLLQIQLLTNDAVPTIFIPVQAKKISISVPTIKIIKKPEPPLLPKSVVGDLLGENAAESPASVTSSLAVEVEAERNDDLDEDDEGTNATTTNEEASGLTEDKAESRKRKAKETSFVAKKKTSLPPKKRLDEGDISINEVHTLSSSHELLATTTRCIAPYCNATNLSEGVLLHEIPTDEAIKDEWMKSLEDAYAKVGLVFNAVVPTGERNVVCSRHFYREDYLTSGRGKNYKRSILPVSVPSLYEDSSLSPFIDESDTLGIPKKKVMILSKFKNPSNNVLSSNGHSFQQENGEVEWCFVKKCTSDSTVSRHYCPEDPEIVSQWVRNLPRREIHFDYTKHGVCIRHFDESFVLDLSNLMTDDDTFNSSSNGGVTLARDAIPTIFDGYPAYLQKKLPKRRSTPDERNLRSQEDSISKGVLKSSANAPIYVSTPYDVSPPTQKRRGRPRKAAGRPSSNSKKAPEMVDGFEIEYEYDDEYFTPVWDTPGNSGSLDAPTLQVNSVRSYAPAKVQLASKRLKESNQNFEFILPDESLNAEQLLDIGHVSYNLDYIFSMKPRIKFPESDNVWNFHLFFDYDANKRVLCVFEMVVRNGRMIFRRAIKIFEDLTFKIECNGSELTQMFTESGNKIDSIPRLQEMISDLAAFTPCEGWSEFPFLDSSSVGTGRKVEGVWFSNECEGLCLTVSRCAACTHFKQSLAVRKNKNVAPEKLVKEITASQIHLLPKNDPIRLTFQINDLKNKHEKSRKEVVKLEKKETSLLNEIKKLKASLANAVKSSHSSRSPKSSSSSHSAGFAKKKTSLPPPTRPGPASSKSRPGPASSKSKPGPASSKPGSSPGPGRPSTSRGHPSTHPQRPPNRPPQKLVRPVPKKNFGDIPIVELSDDD